MKIYGEGGYTAPMVGVLTQPYPGYQKPYLEEFQQIAANTMFRPYLNLRRGQTSVHLEVHLTSSNSPHLTQPH